MDKEREWYWKSRLGLEVWKVLSKGVTSNLYFSMNALSAVCMVKSKW